MKITTNALGVSVEIEKPLSIEQFNIYLQELQRKGYTKIIGSGEGYENKFGKQYILLRLEK